jgi:hypothetical protein
MSSNLLAYKFKNHQWHKADGINESDVVVIVDPSRNLIWYFEGRNSSARKRNKARNLLGDLKNKHSTYKFRKVTTNTPRDIIREFQILKEQFYINAIKNLNIDVSKISSIYFYLNGFGSLLTIFCITISFLYLTGSNIVIHDNFNHFMVRFTDFQLIILLLSSFSLISFICFTITSILSSLFKQKIPAIFNIVGSSMMFLAFLQLNIWDLLIYTDVIGNQIYIRSDVLSIFIWNLNVFFIISIFIAFVMGMIGFRQIDRIIQPDQED